MDKPLFMFEMSGDALRYISKAFDRYVEKWPGGRPEEQELLKTIQLDLHRALLDLQFEDG